MKRTAVSEVFIGTDLVEVDRVRSSIEKSGDRFLDRIFTKTEQKYCQSKANPDIHFAGRFAAKEAIIKALKSAGVKDPIPFSAIDVQPSESGEPIVVLEGDWDGKCKVSISHTDKHAIASAIFILK